MKLFKTGALYLLMILFSGCIPTETKVQLFKKINAEQSGINFVNQLEFRQNFNIYTYRNFYNGGGVGLADINNDGLIDIYFTSNMGDNRLYLNKGNLEFEDITQKAGVAGTRAWSTGVSMADVNGDGFVDIYVSNAGIAKDDDQQNELFINNGDLTFSEEAVKFGLADTGLSIHASFFDYDRDGDLDMYLVNNSFKAIGDFDLENNLRFERDPKGGDRLYRNDDGYFTDVSEEAGILGSIIAFGLGVTVSDINRDGWLDIYISNDFFERDYLYINNGDGTFSEELEQQMRSISAASMGADIADINNDGWMEIFVTEMLPENDARLKTVTTFENWQNYQEKLQNDYYHQFTRNMLHLNNGNGTFSEIGRLAGVEATDWSWGALIADFNNDAKRDIFVSNGVLRDLTNQDYLQYIANPRTVKSIVTRNNVNFKHLIDTIPSNRVPNYMFKNSGNLHFQNMAEIWGLNEPTHSNGSAYGDLDNDGDLDIVLNNLNMTSAIYQNHSQELLSSRNSIQVHLMGENQNTQGVGAKVKVKAAGQAIYAEQIPVRGFQSSVDPRVHIGLDTVTVIDSLTVEWPDGRKNILTDIKTNQILKIEQANAHNKIKRGDHHQKADKKVFTKVDIREFGIGFTHTENSFNEFKRNKLLFHMNSTEGPVVCVGDVNRDERNDFYIGGAKGQSGALYIQNKAGTFSNMNAKVFRLHADSEDTDCTFFDADGNGTADLYVASGGVEFSAASSALRDRLYLNLGDATFTLPDQKLPGGSFTPTSTVEPADFDNDGDIDLFVGSQFQLFKYGYPADGFLLENDGEGRFLDVTTQIAPELSELGLITDAKWVYLNDNSLPYLLIAGKWMSLKLFRNKGGKLKDVTEKSGLSNYKGWWNALEAADFNNDGMTDFAVGNMGLNSRFKASEEKPLRMYVGDFDYNGSIEQVITRFEGDEAYTLALRHNLLEALPSLKSKYPTYDSFKNQTIRDIFEEDELEDAILLEINHLEHAVFMNSGDGTFEFQKMPLEAQFTPVYGIVSGDFDNDSYMDLLTAGNLYSVKPELGPYDAGMGSFLRGSEKGTFSIVPLNSSGFVLRKQIRDLEVIQIDSVSYILTANNDDRPNLFRINN